MLSVSFITAMIFVALRALSVACITMPLCRPRVAGIGKVSLVVAVTDHSLIVARDTLPPALVPNAWTEDGTIMAMHHRDLPIHGVQFHPESIASEHGHQILANFLAIARGANSPARAA